MLPPYLIQRNGVLIKNKVNSDPSDEAYGLPLQSIQNPLYALAVALGNSGYEYFPTAVKLISTLGQPFEDMIVRCRVSDGMATDKETFPISVVGYPVTNNPPIFDNVEDQVFEVGITNHYQIVAFDPDLEDMDELTYSTNLGFPCSWPQDDIIDLITGLITLTPQFEGTLDLIVTVTDPRGMEAMHQFTIFCKILDRYTNHVEIFPGLNSLCIPPGAEELYPNVSSLWDLFIDQNHQAVKIQTYSPDLPKWLTFRKTSSGETHGEDFSLPRGKPVLVYTDQTEVKDLELTAASIQPAPSDQPNPELRPGLNQVNLHRSLFGESNNSETDEEEWPQAKELFQKIDQEGKESTSFMSLNPCRGKWQAKYPFFGLLAGSEAKVGKRGYLVFIK